MYMFLHLSYFHQEPLLHHELIQLLIYKLLEILPKINSNINSDTILKDILDFHNFKLTQLFDYTDTTILLNQTYNRDIAAFNSFCDNIKEGYKQFISNYGDYFKALSMAKVNSTIIDIVKKKLFKFFSCNIKKRRIENFFDSFFFELIFHPTFVNHFFTFKAKILLEHCNFVI